MIYLDCPFCNEIILPDFLGVFYCDQYSTDGALNGRRRPMDNDPYRSWNPDEIAKLTKERDDWERRYHDEYEKNKWVAGDYGQFIGFSLLIAFISSILYAGLSAIFHDAHKIDYCFTTYVTGNAKIKPYYNLYGHVQWSSEMDLGNFDSLSDAIAGADKLHCPMGVGK